MTRDEKIAEARRMRADGAELREIAERLGICRETARRWSDPAAAERSRALSLAWKQRNREQIRAYDAAYGRSHRGRCTECGGPTGIGVARDTMCRPCWKQRAHERALLVVQLWADGLKRPEICARLGWSVDQFAVEMHRMREAGYDLPYHNRGYTKFAPTSEAAA